MILGQRRKYLGQLELSDNFDIFDTVFKIYQPYPRF